MKHRRQGNGECRMGRDVHSLCVERREMLPAMNTSVINFPPSLLPSIARDCCCWRGRRGRGCGNRVVSHLPLVSFKLAPSARLACFVWQQAGANHTTAPLPHYPLVPPASSQRLQRTSSTPSPPPSIPLRHPLSFASRSPLPLLPLPVRVNGTRLPAVSASCRCMHARSSEPSPSHAWQHYPYCLRRRTLST